MTLKLTLSFRILIASTALIAWLAAVPPVAQAHKVSVFAYVDGDTVYTLSKFSGGKKVNKGLIAVFDPEGKKLLDGMTDNQGEFAFKIPQQTALRVELVAGAGHKGHWLVPLEEIVGAPAQPTVGTTGTPPPGKPAEIPPAYGGDDARLQAAIEKALEKKLKPVIKLLVESQQPGPTLTEILGGIGYIIGLVGIAAYFKSRREN